MFLELPVGSERGEIVADEKKQQQSTQEAKEYAVPNPPAPAPRRKDGMETRSFPVERLRLGEWPKPRLN